jgi:hypothetical protein
MSGDRGHMRAMRLLPFAASAVDSLTLSMQTSRIRVATGRWRRSEVFSSRLGSVPVGAVAALCCCTFSHSLTIKCQRTAARKPGDKPSDDAINCPYGQRSGLLASSRAGIP